MSLKKIAILGSNLIFYNFFALQVHKIYVPAIYMYKHWINVSVV